jgi:two-component system chemotaxis sensor kinase CheA
MGKPTNFGEVFLHEAEDLLVTVEERILDVENNPADKEAINGLFRAMHTIKGSGAMFGFDELSRFTHHVETALDLVREGKLKVSKHLIDLVLASRDQIKSMLDEAKGSGKASRATAQEIVDAFIRLAPNDKRMTEVPQTFLAEVQSSTETKETSYRIRFTPNPDIFSFGMDPALVIEELEALGECQTTTQVSKIPHLKEIHPEKCHLSFDVILTTDRSADDIRDVFIFVESGAELTIEKLALDEVEEVPKIGEILVDRGVVTQSAIETALSKQERLGDIIASQEGVANEQINAALAEQAVIRKKKETATQEAVKVPTEKLDRLINLVGELVITQAQLQIASSRIDDIHLATPVEDIGRLTSELRDIALNVRMMPIGSTFNKFRRLVRDLSSQLGKKVQLVTFGEETEMDKTVIDRLGDPLVHLIRNSLDHGIESPEERRSKNKPEIGTIGLSARHQGAQIVVSIEDDGKGLDPDIIRKKAVEKGMVDASQSLTERQIFELIMEPGFSTAKEVSSVSGRGVGMDVVKREISSLRGSIEMNSKVDEGTTISLNLPLTLAIIDGLLVNVGKSKYIIPVSMVEECLEMSEANQAMDVSRNLLTIRGALIPFVRLKEIFRETAAQSPMEEAVIIACGNRSFGIVVDHVVGHHQTVIKSLGPMYRHTAGLSGATIMGDGSVALVVDLAQLMQIADFQEEHLVTTQFQLGEMTIDSLQKNATN